MDYGKLAYLKADELEARINSGTAAKFPPPALYRTSFKTASGRVRLLEGGGTGTAVIVKVSAKNAGDVRLYIGGLRAASARLSGSDLPAVMFGAGSGDVEMEFSSFEGGAKNVDIQLLLPVGTAAASGRASELNMARSGEKCLISSVDGGDVKVEMCDGKYENRLGAETGRGVRADVCAAGSDFCVVYSDVHGLLWSVAVSGELKVLARSLLGEAPENFGITYANKRVYVFFARDGKAKYFSTAYPKGTRGKTSDIDYSGYVVRLTPVKDSEPIAVALESGGKVYLLKEDTAAVGGVGLSVTVKGRAQSV